MKTIFCVVSVICSTLAFAGQQCPGPSTVSGSYGCYDNGSGFTEWVKTVDGNNYETDVSECGFGFIGCTRGEFVIGSYFQSNDEDGECVSTIGLVRCNDSN